jgi:flagella basal body P-ring formation protein FlgA
MSEELFMNTVKRIMALFLLFLLPWTVGEIWAADKAPAAAVKLTPHEIERQAEEFLLERLPWSRDQMELSITYGGETVDIPRDQARLAFELPERHPTMGRIPLSVKIRDENGYSQTRSLRVLVQVYMDVVKTRAAVRRDQILSETDVEVDRIKIARPLRGALTQMEEAVGMKIRRSLEAGEILDVNMMEKPFLVNRGDHIILVAERGTMRITAPGICKERGLKGSIVPVENVETKKTVYGRVVDSNTVEVFY